MHGLEIADLQILYVDLVDYCMNILVLSNKGLKSRTV